MDYIEKETLSDFLDFSRSCRFCWNLQLIGIYRMFYGKLNTNPEPGKSGLEEIDLYLS